MLSFSNTLTGSVVLITSDAQCPSGDIKDACKELHCNSEDWLEDELEETMAE